MLLEVGRCRERTWCVMMWGAHIGIAVSPGCLRWGDDFTRTVQDRVGRGPYTLSAVLGRQARAVAVHK